MTKLERLLTKVDIPEGCWLWTGAKNPTGYGQLRTGPRGDNRLEMAHRAMWEAVHGPILPGRNVLHHCDTPACVRPDHLYLGSHADNARDRTVRERGRHKLTATDVSLARAAYDNLGWTNARLARHFGVTDATMHAVVHRRAWKHVE